MTMKQQLITLMTCITMCLVATNVTAQVDYTYTLVDNGGYSYTIEAVPDASASNFPTSVQSYGFTILVPDGVTATITSSLGSSAGANFFDGSAVGAPAVDGYLITETLGAPISISAPSAGTNSAMVTIQVNGSPTSGTVSILANDDPLALAVPPLQSFFTADTIDNGSAAFINRVLSASGLSGTTSYDFSTLSVADVSQLNFSVYPNPLQSNDEVVKFQWNSSAEKVNITLVDINGTLVKAYNNVQTQAGENTLSLPKMQTGIYFMQFTTSNNQKATKKLIIQ